MLTLPRLNLRAETLERENLALKAAQEPRQIELNAPSFKLKKFSSLSVNIVCPIYSGECMKTAFQIGQIFKNAGFNIQDSNIIGTQHIVQPGISVGICSSNSRWYESKDNEIRKWSGAVRVLREDASGISEGEFSELQQACDIFADEMNNEATPIVTKRDREINRLSTIHFDGILIWVGEKPSILESQIIIAKNDLVSLEQTQENKERLNNSNDADSEEKIRQITDKIINLGRQGTWTNRGVNLSFPVQSLP